MIDDNGVTRRTVLAGTAAAAMAGPATGAGRPASNPAGLRLLTSVDGVNTPPKAAAVMKFSFANPEPSVEFGGLLFGFEVITFENHYGIDPATVEVTRSGSTLRLTATALRWAGGQQARPGKLVAAMTRGADGAIEWTVGVDMDVPVKAVKTIVRGLPRGSVSMAAEEWQDLGEAEKVFEYPALMAGMATPFMALKDGKGRVWGISALQKEVRPARFAFLPGPGGYKLELLYEQAGWDRRGDVRTCGWRIAADADIAAAARRHFTTVEEAWSIPDFSGRADAPAWMKRLACVVALHGEHWTGYVFNDFARQLAILRWIARLIDPTTVMVFLPGWDARYYWDYPAFEPGERTGGMAGLERLVAEGRKLGFRFALMFGSNVANPASPLFPSIADARLLDIYGAPFPANYVDWDADRKGDGSMTFMNLAVKSWRDHLSGRIATMIDRLKLDAYFLDICGLWENNPQGDMLLGTRTMVADLARSFPAVPAIAEMQYDAQMAFIPMSHAARYSLYPQANDRKVVSFNHLSWPAPGRGSTGVHEYGFNTYRPVTVEQRQIPTITFVDDTFTTHREAVMKDLATARSRFEKRGGKT
jgi:hypothetical protein